MGGFRPPQSPVFSACAEVVPPYLRGSAMTYSILRVRGGSSNTKAEKEALEEYSPRARR